ncbi:MAG: fold metallo-hydrolase [Nonomuraea muscovyensis]|nr:fold metallo-hydrolase [Nonomuraea muscovyensis]
MPHPPRIVAGAEVTPLCDAVGAMGPAIRRPMAETFPGAALDEEPWILHFHCYLIRDRTGRVTLVDTGIGAADSPASSWAPVPGSLDAELAAAGVTPADVDVVILTHLHSDHASGAVTDAGPRFVNARHVVQQADLDVVGGEMLDRVVTPIKDRLHVVEGDEEVVPGVRVHLTAGHTPGHQIVRVGELAITGDLVLHPVQLADPSIHYVYDDDPERAAATRAEVLAGLRAERAILATAHFTDPFLPL